MKLTIVVAIHDTIQNSSIVTFMTDIDITKRFLIKTYNKLNTQHEIGVSEVISHLLNMPDHYTDVVFERLHTSHLLRYIEKFSQNKHSDPKSDNGANEILDVQVIRDDRKYNIVSSFDNYTYQGPNLIDLYR